MAEQNNINMEILDDEDDDKKKNDDAQDSGDDKNSDIDSDNDEPEDLKSEDDEASDEDDDASDEDDDDNKNDNKNTNQNTLTENLNGFDDNFGDDEDDDDEEDEHYLQKFDENIQRKIISDYHPDLQTHNYDEIDILSRVVRNTDGVIIDPLHKTLPFITKYEKARIIGERAKQLNSGAKPVIEVESTLIDGYLIALKEFEEKKIPYIVKRPLPSGGVEYWKMRDLEILA